MADKLVSLTLPEWAWLNGGEHEKGGDPLEGRNVITHVRSASVIEFFLEDDFVPNTNVLTYAFSYRNPEGITERHIAALHYSATHEEPEVLRDILKRAARWYCDYMKWEDENIINEELASLN